MEERRAYTGSEGVSDTARVLGALLPPLAAYVGGMIFQWVDSIGVPRSRLRFSVGSAIWFAGTAAAAMVAVDLILRPPRIDPKLRGVLLFLNAIPLIALAAAFAMGGIEVRLGR